jgi:hypothetical protein
MTSHTPDQNNEGHPNYFGEKNPSPNSYFPTPSQYQQPYPYQGQFPPLPVPPTNTAAVVSFIASISSLLFLWMIPLVGVAASVVGVIYGHKSLKEAKITNNGRGLGIAGMACGYAGLLNAISLTMFFAFLLLSAGAEGVRL